MTVQQDSIVVPWAPEDLAVAATALAGRLYVVVEEIVDEITLLRRWSWPTVDQLGRLAWSVAAEEDMDAATIDLDILRSQLYLPNGIMRRPRVGDTFCVEWAASDARWRSRHVRDVRSLFVGEVYDVSADAREAAKLAYQAGLAAVASPARVEERERTAGLAALDARTAAPLSLLRIDAPNPLAARAFTAGGA